MTTDLRITRTPVCSLTTVYQRTTVRDTPADETRASFQTPGTTS